MHPQLKRLHLFEQAEVIGLSLLQLVDLPFQVNDEQVFLLAGQLII